MINILRFVIFFVTFSIEIEIRAEIVSLLNQEALIKYPSNCEETLVSCGYKTYNNRKYLIQIKDNVELTLGSDTIVIKNTESSWALVQGEIIFKAKAGYVVETPMGSLVAQDDNSIFYVTKKDGSYLVRSLFGSVGVKPIGSSEITAIPNGYENLIKGVGETGSVQIGFPAPVQIQEWLPKWAQLFNGTRQEFANLLAEFKPSHARAVEEISATYASISERMIASYNEAQQKEAERKKKNKEEKELLQKMFKQKTLGLE